MSWSAIETSVKLRIPREIAPCKWGATEARTSFAQQALNILRLVEVLGGLEPDRCNEPCRYQVGCEEIGTGDRNAGEIGAAQRGTPERGVGQIRILEICEFEVDARQIGIAQDRSLEIGGFQYGTHEPHGLVFHVGAEIGADEQGADEACPG
jgi:hypothetical protein